MSGASIICMRAANHAFGINAQNVRTMAKSDTELPHLAEVLGIDTPARADAENTRVLAIEADGETIQIIVDRPIGLLELERGHILPMTPSIRQIAWAGLVGFASVSDTLIQLLDPKALIGAAKRLRPPGGPDDAGA